jgi:hypothetical protein
MQNWFRQTEFMFPRCALTIRLNNVLLSSIPGSRLAINYIRDQVVGNVAVLQQFPLAPLDAAR